MIGQAMGQPKQDVVRPEAMDVDSPSDEDFAALIDRLQSPLLRYTRQMINSAEDAEDIVQTAFLRLHKQVEAEGWESINNVSSWLYRVAHNLAIDFRRKRLRRSGAQDTLIDQAHESHQRRSPNEGLEDLVQRETAQRALAMLHALPEDQQQVILLKVVEGLTLRQIGQILDLNVGNVYYRLNRGLADLAKRLKEAGEI